MIRFSQKQRKVDGEDYRKEQRKAVAELLANMYDMSLDRLPLIIILSEISISERFIQQNYGVGTESLNSVRFNKRENI